MPRSVFASFQTAQDAEAALSALESDLSLLDSAIVSDGASGALTLDSLELSPEERSACRAQMKRGGFLMIAQADDSTAEGVLKILQGLPADVAPLIIAEASSPVREAPEQTVEEERIPIAEEELQVGKREVVRGRTVVQSHTTEIPAEERVDLLEETILTERRPADRALTDEEIERAGLLADRVIEVAAMREEAVVSKEAFVREEVVITKNVEQRVEEIKETLRRTEVRTEQLHPETDR